MVHDDFTPRFTVDPDEYNKEYVSLFGPAFDIKYNFPGSGADEHRTAIGRMIALRAPDIPGLNEILINNQKNVGRLLRCSLHRFKMYIESRINRKLYDESYPEWLLKPHAKRMLRIDQEIENTIQGTDRNDDFIDVKFKLKKNEFLPDGKNEG
jgi:hypothetical protein